MRSQLLLAGLLLTATPGLADRRDVTLALGDRVATITASGAGEVLSVGLPGGAMVDVLSGADVEIVAAAGGPETIALFGAPIMVLEVTGTHSCDDGDPLAYYVEKLGLVPGAPQGPLTSCGPLAVTIADGLVTLTPDPGRKDAEAWTWEPATGFVPKAD